MKRVYKILFGIVAMVLAAACGGDDSPVGEKWGYTECYEDFMGYNYEPTIMERELEFTLSPDACKLFDGKGYITFYVSESKDEYVAPKGVNVYLNGEKCDNHCLKVYLGDIQNDKLSLNVGLQFTEIKDVNDYTLYFGYDIDEKSDAVSYNKSVRIDGVVHNVVLAEDLQVDLGELESVGVVVEQKVIMNPLLNILLWVLGSIITIFILSIIISRMMTPTIKVSRIVLTGVYHKQLRVRGYNSVVFTSRKQKQGFFSKLYKGTILYEVHPSWVSDVNIKPCNNRSVRLQRSNDYMCDSLYLEKNKSYVLENTATRQKTDVRIH